MLACIIHKKVDGLDISYRYMINSRSVYSVQMIHNYGIELDARYLSMWLYYGFTWKVFKESFQDKIIDGGRCISLLFTYVV